MNCTYCGAKMAESQDKDYLAAIQVAGLNGGEVPPMRAFSCPECGGSVEFEDGHFWTTADWTPGDPDFRAQNGLSGAPGLDQWRQQERKEAQDHALTTAAENGHQMGAFERKSYGDGHTEAEGYDTEYDAAVCRICGAVLLVRTQTRGGSLVCGGKAYNEPCTMTVAQLKKIVKGGNSTTGWTVELTCLATKDDPLALVMTPAQFFRLSGDSMWMRYTVTLDYARRILIVDSTGHIEITDPGLIGLFKATHYALTGERM